MRKWLLLVLLSIIFFESCKDNTQNSQSDSILQEEIQFTKEGTLTITAADTDTTRVDQLNIEIAETDYETETGLMYRNSMDQNQGMLFIFDEIRERFFYMKNTTIPLDIIYIKADKTIATIVEDAQPMQEENLPSGEPVKFVLEVNAGMSKRWGLKTGDTVDWTRL